MAAALALCAASAPAQSVPSSGQRADARSAQARIVGQVLSDPGGRPLPLATVELPALGRSTVTDQNGRYRFDRVPAGEHGMRVRMLGYGTRWQAVAAGASDAAVVRLQEDAVMLEGLTVTTSRLQRRLRALSRSVRVVERADIVNSGVRDAHEFFLDRTSLSPARCTSRGESECFYIRGAPRQPLVYVDDALAPGGMDQLRDIRREELARVEIISRGAEVRVYTARFMEWAVKHNYHPPAFLVP